MLQVHAHDAENALKRPAITYAVALLRVYLYWLKDLQEYDRHIEGILRRQPSEIGRVDGGISVPEQERILAYKERDPEYQKLVRCVAKMRRILGELDDRKMEFIQLYIWNETPWQEIAEIFHISKATVYLWKDEIALFVASRILDDPDIGMTQIAPHGDLSNP